MQGRRHNSSKSAKKNPSPHKMRGQGGRRDAAPFSALGVSLVRPGECHTKNFPPRAKLNAGEGKEEGEGTRPAMGALLRWVLVVCMSIST